MSREHSRGRRGTAGAQRTGRRSHAAIEARRRPGWRRSGLCSRHACLRSAKRWITCVICLIVGTSAAQLVWELRRGSSRFGCVRGRGLERVGACRRVPARRRRRKGAVDAASTRQPHWSPRAAREACGSAACAVSAVGVSPPVLGGVGGCTESTQRGGVSACRVSRLSRLARGGCIAVIYRLSRESRECVGVVNSSTRKMGTVTFTSPC